MQSIKNCIISTHVKNTNILNHKNFAEYDLFKYKVLVHKLTWPSTDQPAMQRRSSRNSVKRYQTKNKKNKTQQQWTKISLEMNTNC